MAVDAKDSGKTGSKPSEKVNFKDCDGIVQFKIVYWGPGESGKTTNFMRLKEKFSFIRLTDG